MNNILNIKTPAEAQADATKSDYGIDTIGLLNLRKAYWNLTTEALYEEIIFRGEAQISRSGPIVVNTGKHTARAANDKFIVREPTTENNIWWGQYNRPYSTEKFDELFSRLQGFLQGRDVFIQDCYGGADENFRLPVQNYHRICLAQFVCSEYVHQTKNERRISKTCARIYSNCYSFI